MERMPNEGKKWLNQIRVKFPIKDSLGKNSKKDIVTMARILNVFPDLVCSLMFKHSELRGPVTMPTDYPHAMRNGVFASMILTDPTKNFPKENIETLKYYLFKKWRWSSPNILLNLRNHPYSMFSI